MLLLPRFMLNDKLTIDDLIILQSTDNAAKRVSLEIDKTIQLALESSLDSNELEEFKKTIVYVIEELSSFAIKVNELFGSSINIYDILKYLEDPKFIKLINFKINEKDNYFDISKSINLNTKKIVDYFKEKKDSAIYNILDSISFGQFQQVFSSVGYKPNVISSDIYPHAVNTNLFRGMRSPKDYFVSSMGARKALITNAVQVRRAGYISRKLILLVLNQFLSKEHDDCGSTDYLIIDITSQDDLNRFQGRYYLNEDDNTLEIINKYDKSLIGKTLKIRTPITCISEDGHICPTCYGNLHKINNTHIGISSILNLTEQFIQRLLSTKHLLQINPEKIDLPAELENYFILDKTTLIAKKSFKLKINSVQVFDDNEIVTNSFTIIEDDGSSIVINVPNKDLYLDKIIDRINLYNLENEELLIEDEDEVFLIQVENSELVTPLKKLTKLLESDDELNFKSPDVAKDYHMIIREMIDLLNQAGISSSSNALELIIREMIRNVEDIQERPVDFSNRDSYKMLKLTSAILHHPSAAITLSFERLTYVLENNLFKKNAPSLIDGLY
jgi:hypothetical protein